MRACLQLGRLGTPSCAYRLRLIYLYIMSLVMPSCSGNAVMLQAIGLFPLVEKLFGGEPLALLRKRAKEFLIRYVVNAVNAVLLQLRLSFRMLLACLKNKEAWLVKNFLSVCRSISRLLLSYSFLTIRFVPVGGRLLRQRGDGNQ